MEKFSGVRLLIILTAMTSLLFFVFVSQADSAALQKRSVSRGNFTGPCRTNGVCGWEVYEKYTKRPQYYISSSCVCVPEETCIRQDEDYATYSYIFRCINRRKKAKTTATSNSTVDGDSNVNNNTIS